MTLLTLLAETAPAVADAITPSVDEVAALERERTWAPEGEQTGTFTPATRPTAAHVRELIDFAVNDVLSRIGTVIPQQWQGEVRRLASVQTAALIESSYFPAELDTDRSAYRQYSAMFLAGIETLRANVLQPSALRLV